MHPALIYHPGDRLEVAELSAARIDGLVVEIDGAYMPADTIEGMFARAYALSRMLPRGMAFMGPSAAWLHGAGDAAPRVHHLARVLPRRLRHPVDPRRVIHEIRLNVHCLTHIGPVPTTTPTATLVDLVRMGPGRPDFVRWADALADVHPEAVAEAEAELLRRGRTPGRRAALAQLGRLSRPV